MKMTKVSSPINISNMKEINYSLYRVYLNRHAKPPVEYVLDKFKEHDVVILGEEHEVKENLLFIHNLIEPLYYRGNVRCFAMELLKSKNITLANQLVTNKKYDQQLAISLFRDCGWPTWGFKEYISLLKAIWKLNQKLSPQAERFEVVPLSSDWTANDLFSESWNEEAHDNHMADFLSKEVLGKGKKALVQIGYNHSFSHYRQPCLRNGKFIGEGHSRFGRILYEKYKDRIFQICLHLYHRRSGERSPFLIEFMEKIFSFYDNRPLGFNIYNSPFANLRDQNSYYFAFQKNVVFSDIARGYIFLKPLSEQTKITWVKGFIDNSNYERAKVIALKLKWIKEGECNSPQELDEKLRLIFEAPSETTE